MAYTKNEKKLKEYLNKQNDTKDTNRNSQKSTRISLNDKYIRRGRHI